MHRHLLVACETVLLIVELHSPELLKYKTGNNASGTVNFVSTVYIGHWGSDGDPFIEQW